MNRGRHYYRQGNGEGQQRDLQVNGSARAHGPYAGAHATFAAPGDSYQGFAADGYWREAGAVVEASLTNAFGTTRDGELNTLKWTAPTSPRATVPDMKDAHFELPYLAAGGDGTDTYQGRFELRGDFRIEMTVTTTSQPAGTGAGAGDDCAVWLGVRQKATPTNYWRAKKTHTDVSEGFAGEVAGVGAQEGFHAAPDIDTFKLVIIRVDGTLELRAWYDLHPDTLLWSGAAAGILEVDFTAQFIAGGNWTVNFERFDHYVGWHDYSNRASWHREAAAGMLYDAFVGDEVDPAIWTVTEDGAATATPGDGLHFECDGIGEAVAESLTITGDFTATIPIRWTRPDDHAPTGEEEEVAIGVEVRSADGGYPRLCAEIIQHHTDIPDSVETVRGRLVYREDAMAADVILVTFDDFPVGAGQQRGSVTFMRRGLDFTVWLDDDSAGIRRWEHTNSDLPSYPVSIALRCAVAVGSTVVDASVDYVQVSSPHALVGDTWPTDWYAAGTLAASTEVEPASGTLINEATLIHAVDRRPVWRIVGAGIGGVNESFDQAIPGGTIADVWPEPAEGTVWIPVQTPTGGSDDGFFEIDLRLDQIRRHRGANVADFLGRVGQRHLGHAYNTGAVASPGMPTGVPLLYRFTDATAADTTALTVAATVTQIVISRDGGSVTVWGDDTPLVTRAILLAPLAGEASLVVFGFYDGADLLTVYPTLSTLALAGGAESFPGQLATTTYDNSDFGGGVGDGTGDATAQQTAAGIIIGLARGPEGGAVLQGAAVQTWAITATDPPGAGELSSSPVSVALALAPRMDTGGNGWIIFGGQETEDQQAQIEIASIRTGSFRERLDYSSVVATFAGDPNATPQGLIALEPVPDGFAGVRVAIGLLGDDAGIVEIDLLTITGGPWRGPHIGGTRFGWTGFGADSVTGVAVGGVRCFGARLQPASLGREPVFSAVNRSLGFIINDPPHPAVTDAALEAEDAEWPQDVTITLNDGSALTLEGAFTYYADPEIDRTARRLMRRIPEEVLDSDVKADHDWRHLAIACAWGMRSASALLANVEADHVLETATGVGLDMLAGSFDAVPPVELDDASLRNYVTARAFGNRVTPKAIKDILEAVLGDRPGIEEGYREFTILLADPYSGQDGSALDTNWYGDDDGINPLDYGFFGRDYYGGENVQVAAARTVLDTVRAAGVEPKVAIRPAE